jgi:hypothetical protein
VRSSLYLKGCLDSSQWNGALLRQRGRGLGAVRTDAIRADTALDTVAYNDGFATARARDVEVLEPDVLAHGARVRRARQLRHREAVLAARVPREVLEVDIGNVHLRRVLRAGGGVDLGARLFVSFVDSC